MSRIFAISISFNLRWYRYPSVICLPWITIREGTRGPCRRCRTGQDQLQNVSLARLTPYCGRIYEIRGDDIPPSTYPRTCRVTLLWVTSPFQYVNLLDLSACPYPPASIVVTCICVTPLLQIADPNRISHFVFLPSRKLLATMCLHARYSPNNRFRTMSRNCKTWENVHIEMRSLRFRSDIEMNIYQFRMIRKR